MKIAVISAGVKMLPERFAKILCEGGWDAKFYPLDPKVGYNYIKWRDIDLLWNWGFFFRPDQLFDSLKARYKHLTILNHWVGTDIINTANYLRALPKCRHCILRSVDIHVVDCVDFIKELKEGLGIDKAWFVPSVPEPMPLTPLPSEFAVSCYVPPHRQQFYGFPQVIEVAKELTEVPFYVFPSPTVGWGSSTPPLPNVHLTSFVEEDAKLEWWSRVSAHISIPVHGGVSLTMIEHLMMGRRAVCNKKLPHVYHVEEPVKPKTIVEKLKEIREFKEPDEEASEYYHKEYSYERVLEHVKPILEA